MIASKLLLRSDKSSIFNDATVGFTCGLEFPQKMLLQCFTLSDCFALCLQQKPVIMDKISVFITKQSAKEKVNSRTHGKTV